MPVYRGEAHIEQALASLARQNDEGVEVIIVDDGSDDTTCDIVSLWAERLRLRLMRQPRRANWIAATNKGLAAARGEWLGILHQDDVWMAERSIALKHAIQRFSEAKLLFHSAHLIDSPGNRIGQWRCPVPHGHLLYAADLLPRLVIQNFIPVCAPLFHRDLFERAGPMDERLWYFGDWDYWLKLASIGPSVYLRQNLAAFRIHPASQTAKRTRDLDEVARQFVVTTDRARRGPAFPASLRGRAKRDSRFGCAAYLMMLAAVHGVRGPWREFMISALKAGPTGWWRYVRFAQLQDRIVPRLKFLPFLKPR